MIILTLLAQNKTPIDDWGPSVGWLQGLGKLGDIVSMNLGGKHPCGAIDKLNMTMSTIVGLLTIIAGLYFVFLLFGGALAWLSAGGDKMATENAQKRITHGLVGLVIIIAGIFLIDLVSKILGLDILNPGKFIDPSCASSVTLQ